MVRYEGHKGTGNFIPNVVHLLQGWAALSLFTLMDMYFRPSSICILSATLGKTDWPVNNPMVAYVLMRHKYV